MIGDSRLWSKNIIYPIGNIKMNEQFEDQIFHAPALNVSKFLPEASE